jgi:GWxTD domain-containing protein
MRHLCTLAIAAVLSVTSLLAADLGKYQDWKDSPDAYFMTSAEREQWAKQGSETEAAQFVQKYAADRGGEAFTKELAKRVAMADKYLTIGDTPGSKSMRGRIVILLGPPAALNVSVKQARSAGHSGTADMAFAAGGEGGGTSVSEVAGVSQREGMTGADSGLRDYTFSYGAATLGTPKDALLTVEVNAKTGKDRVADKKAAAELEKLLESAAQKSIVAAK